MTAPTASECFVTTDDCRTLTVTEQNSATSVAKNYTAIQIAHEYVEERCSAFQWWGVSDWLRRAVPSSPCCDM